MNIDSDSSRSTVELPFLQKAKGWKFFLEVAEFTPKCWPGTVRILTVSTRMTSRLDCVAIRASESEALQDAKDFALVISRKVEEREQREEAFERLQPV